MVSLRDRVHGCVLDEGVWYKEKTMKAESRDRGDRKKREDIKYKDINYTTSHKPETTT